MDPFALSGRPGTVEEGEPGVEGTESDRGVDVEGPAPPPQKVRSSSMAVVTLHVQPAPPPFRFFFQASPPPPPSIWELPPLEKDDLVLRTGVRGGEGTEKGANALKVTNEAGSSDSDEQKTVCEVTCVGRGWLRGETEEREVVGVDDEELEGAGWKEGTLGRTRICGLEG